MAKPKSPEVYTYRGGERLALRKATDAFVVRAAAAALDADVGATASEKVSPSSTRITVPRDRLDAAMLAARRTAPAHHAYSLTDTGSEFLITDRVLVRFRPGTPTIAIDELAARHALVTLEVYGPTERLFQLTDHTGMNPVKLVVLLSENEPIVELAENDLNQRMQRRSLAGPAEALYARTWHLHGRGAAGQVDPRASSRCEQAWELLGGHGSAEVVIALADDGCRLGHPDFDRPGKFADWGYFSASRLVRRADPDALPARMYQTGSNHGTACAGVAAAEVDGVYTVGAAPGCRLLPLKWEASGPFLSISDSKLLTALNFIADKADIFSNSWGGVPDNLFARIVVERIHALSNAGGRRGKGIVFLWAAGNENCPIQFDATQDVPYTDGWDPTGRRWVGVRTARRFRNTLVGLPGVLHVAASTSLAQRSHYSNYGVGIDIAAPSSNSHAYWRMSVPGLAIIAPSGQGTGVDRAFGGTSSATPLVAGIAAMVISVNPALTAAEVISVLRRSASRDLDLQPYARTPVGLFDPDTSWDVSPVAPFDRGDFRDIQHADGTWSPWFGFGRVDAEAAVRAAREVATAPGETVLAAQPALPIPDNDPAGVEHAVESTAAGWVASLRLAVEITHSYIGDLSVTLVAPSGAQARVHYRVGGSRVDLQREWSSAETPALAALLGQPAAGRWRLQVRDLAPQDSGTLRVWTLGLRSA